MNNAPTIGASGLLEMMLSLALVVGLIIALSWLIGRMRGIARGGAGPLSVVGEIAIGPKERIVLVRIGDAQALVGVSSAGMTPLTLLDRTIVLPETPVAAGTFAQRLRDAMQRPGSSREP